MAGKDPYAADRTPRVTLEIDGQEYGNVKEYQYESNVLQLGDPFRCTLGSPDGVYGLQVDPGSSVALNMFDPGVSGGAKVTKLRGVVTAVDLSSDNAAGTTLTVSGADLGWHLANNCAPLWFRLKGQTWDRLLNACIYPHLVFKGVADPKWGFQGVRFDNDTNRRKKVNNGRAGVSQELARELGNPKAILPPIQVEAGQMISDVLIHYAKLSKCLVNVSADGYIQIFQPRYDTPTKYTFHHHAATEKERSKNNVKSASLSRSLDGIYTQIDCLSTITRPPKAENVDDPNRGKKREAYKNPSALPFRRYLTFTDTEQLTNAQIAKRARWRSDRGRYDSQTITYTVKGHSQQGNYYEPDTMAEVDDTVFGLRGRYYVSAVRYQQSPRTGSESVLTLKEKDLLSA